MGISIKNIILCADDYGQDTEVSDAIIHLVEKNRLSAVSCMSNSLDWPKQAARLTPFINHIDLGLHFNLTSEHPLSKKYKTKSLANLIISSHLLLLSYDTIKKELQAQLTAFSKALGRMPDFIDGHQHIHHLPTVRQALLDVCYENNLSKNIYIRIASQHSAPDLLSEIKAKIIHFTGAHNLQRMLDKEKVAYNSRFSGIYNFNSHDSYASIFPSFIKQRARNTIIMCHPGTVSKQDKNDPISTQRINEYRYLISDTFIEDCKQHNVQLSRFIF